MPIYQFGVLCLILESNWNGANLDSLETFKHHSWKNCPFFKYRSWISKTDIVLPLKWTRPNYVTSISVLQYARLKIGSLHKSSIWQENTFFGASILGLYQHIILDFFFFGDHLPFGAKVFSQLKPKTIISNHLLMRYEAFSKWPQNIALEKWKRLYFN